MGLFSSVWSEKARIEFSFEKKKLFFEENKDVLYQSIVNKEIRL